MTHGDDNGVVLPPRLAPTQVVIVPIWRNDDQAEAVRSKAAELKARLVEQGVRVKIDEREHLSPGNKFYEWERKGVPIRMELGPKDLENDQVVLVKRVRAEDEDRKEFLPEAQALAEIPGRLDAFQASLLEAAKERREANSHRGVEDIGQLKEILESGGGFVYTGWSGDPEVEERVKEETKATLRCIPDEEFRSSNAPTKCIGGGVSKMEVVWDRAY